MAFADGIEMKKEKLEESDEEFIHNDKVISIVNLLNKYKVKLWECPNLEAIEPNAKINSINSSLEVNYSINQETFF